MEELKEDEFFTTPQTFVNELFKLHHQKLLDDRMLDDHILTVMVGVRVYKLPETLNASEVTYKYSF